MQEDHTVKVRGNKDANRFQSVFTASNFLFFVCEFLIVVTLLYTHILSLTAYLATPKSQCLTQS